MPAYVPFAGKRIRDFSLCGRMTDYHATKRWYAPYCYVSRRNGEFKDMDLKCTWQRHARPLLRREGLRTSLCTFTLEAAFLPRSRRRYPEENEPIPTTETNVLVKRYGHNICRAMQGRVRLLYPSPTCGCDVLVWGTFKGTVKAVHGQTAVVRMKLRNVLEDNPNANPNASKALVFTGVPVTALQCYERVPAAALRWKMDTVVQRVARDPRVSRTTRDLLNNAWNLYVDGDDRGRKLVQDLEQRILKQRIDVLERSTRERFKIARAAIIALVDSVDEAQDAEHRLHKEQYTMVTCRNPKCAKTLLKRFYYFNANETRTSVAVERHKDKKVRARMDKVLAATDKGRGAQVSPRINKHDADRVHHQAVEKHQKTGLKCITCHHPIAVSYTHLTLPTLYSV